MMKNKIVKTLFTDKQKRPQKISEAFEVIPLGLEPSLYLIQFQ